MKSKQKLLILHHTAVSRVTQPSQFFSVNRYHKEKNWGTVDKPWYQSHPTKYGYYHGYTHFMGTNGVITKTRGLDEDGLHTKGYNKSEHIAICIAGNFSVELPNDRQIASLRQFIIDNPEYEVKFHNELGKTSCPGNLFTRDYFETMIMGIYPKLTKNDKEKQEIITRYKSLLNTLREILMNLLNSSK